MKCPNCKFDLPDDSEFCIYCGIDFATVDFSKKKQQAAEEHVEEVKVPDSIAGGKHPEKAKHAHGHSQEQQQQAQIQAQQQVQQYLLNDTASMNNTNQVSAADKKKSLRKAMIGLCLISLLFLASFMTNFYQYNRYNSLIKSLNSMLSDNETSSAAKIADRDEALAEKDQTIASQAETISEQNEQIESLNTQVVALSAKAEAYDDFCDALSNSDEMGYGSGNFYASESVIVVRKNQKNRKFTLTAAWDTDAGVGISYKPKDHPSASVDFDNKQFKKTTKMSVIPHEAGVTTVTFYNDKTNDTFDIIIIVTE